MAESTAFSVWMCPGGELAEKFAGLIREVGREFDGPPFQPHATLLGNAPKGSTEEARVAVQRLASSLEPFEVRVLPEMTFHDTWNQNVLLYVEESEELKAANRKAQEVLRNEPKPLAKFAAPSHRPHLSLIYGDHPPELRPKIVSWIQEQAPWAVADASSFLLEEIQLWAVDGGWSTESVPRWHFVDAFKLGSSSADKGEL